MCESILLQADRLSTLMHSNVKKKMEIKPFENIEKQGK